MLNQKDINALLRHAHDLPSLVNEFRSLANTVLDLEIKKKELSTQLTDLRHFMNQYQHAIDIKKEKISQMSELAIREAS